MARTHLSGLEIGNPETGFYCPVAVVAVLRFAALNAPQKLSVQSPCLLFTAVACATGVSGPAVETWFNLGLTPGGGEIFDANLTANDLKNIAYQIDAGSLWAQIESGTPPITVWLMFSQ